MPGSVMVVGLGNRFLSDDAVGLRIVEALRGRLPEGVKVSEYEEMDLSLLQELNDSARLIVLIDSVLSGAPPGTVSLFRFIEDDGGPVGLPSLHELNLSEMVVLARRLGIVSCAVLLVGVEPATVEIGEGLSEAVELAVPIAVDAVLKHLGDE